MFHNQKRTMPVHGTGANVCALDGLNLAGTLVTPAGTTDRAVVMVHGGGVTREECGFFTRLACRRPGSAKQV